MDPQQQLDHLAAAIDRLRLEFERFFNGATAIPPEELRTQIQNQLRQLRNTPLRHAADSFRLGTLEARYNSFNELFNRRLRNYEEGRGPSIAATAGPSPRYDVSHGVVFDDRTEMAAVEALYEGLHRGAGDAPRFDLDTFRNYLQQQVSSIRHKTGCDRVQFRLADEGGKIKLKAKPVGAGGDTP